MNRRIKVGRLRIYIRSGWQSKDHPYWFFNRTGFGGWTWQSMWFNVHMFGNGKVG